VALLGATAAVFAAGAGSASSQVIYSQNFESPVTAGSGSTGPGGYVVLNDLGGSGWQVQGGGGGGGAALTAGVDANGVGGSQALFANWDHSAATDYTYNQYTVYGAVNPAGAGVTPSQVQVDLDLFMSGSESANNPIEVIIQNGGPDISFTPVLANGVYTHVSYTLNQATNSGTYNPLASSNVRLQHGAGGFGFDAGNTVRADNIVIQVIPEPASLGFALAGGVAFLVRRRTRR
jgi:hypothetical protein